jgi:hypothetical protein
MFELSDATTKRDKYAPPISSVHQILALSCWVRAYNICYMLVTGSFSPLCSRTWQLPDEGIHAHFSHTKPQTHPLLCRHHVSKDNGYGHSIQSCSLRLTIDYLGCELFIDPLSYLIHCPIRCKPSKLYYQVPFCYNLFILLWKRINNSLNGLVCSLHIYIACNWWHI